MLDITTTETTVKKTPKIIVIGVGGAGSNAINNMIVERLECCEFAVCNTDAQALDFSKAEKKFQIGKEITDGLGAGARPDIGRQAAEENIDEISKYIDGANMVFISAGMGGGTGTGSAPVIARAAREKGILTVGIVTKPFEMEGTVRMKHAQEGIEELQKYVDTLIVIPNEKLFTETAETESTTEAFKKVDRVLLLAVQGVTDLMVKPGKINLDFNDIKTVMENKGKAMMGVGEADKGKDGTDASSIAAELAIRNRLLDEDNMKGAKSAIINITSSSDISLQDVRVAVNRLREEIDLDAEILLGQTIDDSMGDTIRVSIVATGIDEARQSLHTPNKFDVEQPNPEALWNESAEEESSNDEFLINQEPSAKIVPPMDMESPNIESEMASFEPSEQPVQEQPSEKLPELLEESSVPQSEEQYSSVDPFIEADMANATRDDEHPTETQVNDEQPEKKGFFKSIFGGFSSDAKAVEKTEPIVSDEPSQEQSSQPMVTSDGSLALETNPEEDKEMEIPPFLRKQLN